MTESQKHIVTQLIDRARQCEARGQADWRRYESLKRSVASMALSPDDYESATLNIARALGLA